MSAVLKQPSALGVERIAGAIGAKITGLDASAPFTSLTRDFILEAFKQHQLLVIRNQSWTHEQHMEFSSMFGPFMDLPHIPRVPGFDLLHQVRREADLSNKRVPGENWHTDSTFLASPPKAVVMRAVDVPDFGGDTAFTSMYAAYESLSEKMREMLDGLSAVHSATKVFGRESLKREPLLQLREGLSTAEGDRETVHPVVCTHHESGRKHLFVNLTYTQRFEGMTVEESKPLLDYLCAHATRPEFGCRLRWRNDTVVIWDNRCTMHRAIPDFLQSFRYLERTTIGGVAPQR